MTVKEKLGQLQQLSYGAEEIEPAMEARIAAGMVSSFLNTPLKVETINKMQ